MIVEWIITSSILVVFVVALRCLFKGRISLRLQYALWALVLLRLLVPVSFGSSAFSVANVASVLQRQVISQEITENGQQYEAMPEQDAAVATPGIDHGGPIQVVPGDTADHRQTVSDEHSTESAKKEAPVQSPALRLSEIAFWVWIAGGAVVCAVFGLTNLRFRALIIRSRRFLCDEGGLRVYVTPEIDTPCLFGVLRPAIYLTFEAAEEPKICRHAIAHETTHYRHGDHIWAILRCLCLMLHWYNPLVWWAATLSQRDAELACDESTIHKLGEQERAEYGRTLIGMTCQKRPNILMSATTMTTRKSAIRERIILIANKPRVTTYTLIAVLAIAAMAVGCTFTGEIEDKPTEKPDAVEQTSGTTEPSVMASMPEETIPNYIQDYVGPPLGAEALYDSLDEDKVCIRIVSTEASPSMDHARYIIPENQEPFLSAFANALPYSQEEVQAGGRATGWVIDFDGKAYSVYDNGLILIQYGYDGCIPAEYGAPIYALCKAASQEAGVAKTVYPDEITGIKSATLQWNGTHTVTDSFALAFLETRLQASEYLPGGAMCPFTAQLILELENGETKTLAMAADSCAAWMSEGVCYSYGVLTEDGYMDNSEFYSVFAADVIHDLVDGDRATLWEYLQYLDWGRYERKYGPDETFALMDIMKEEALRNENKVFTVLYETTGLDGAYADRYSGILADLYVMYPDKFAHYYYEMAYVLNGDDILSLVAYDMGITKDELIADLEKHRSQ